MKALDKEVASLKILLSGVPVQRVLTKTHEGIKKRVFKDGNNSAGSKIGGGRYSKGYQALRKRKGVQPVSKIVIVFTGETRDSFKFTKTSFGYKSDFINSAASNKGGWVESTYNQKIFGLTNNEERDITVNLNKEVKKILNVS